MLLILHLRFTLVKPCFYGDYSTEIFHVSCLLFYTHFREIQPDRFGIVGHSGITTGIKKKKNQKPLSE